jgi:addiction module RelB/DinJ family antitoxin
MDNAVLQIRISQKLKKKSMIVAENLGFTTSTLIKLFLAHVVQSRKIPFEIEEIPNAKFLKAMKQAELDHKNGNYDSFDDMDDAIDFLKKSIKSRKYASRVKSKLQKNTKKTTSSHPRKDFSNLAIV